MTLVIGAGVLGSALWFRRAAGKPETKVETDVPLPLSDLDEDLFRAVRNGDAEAVRLNLEKGANPDAVNSFGITPIRAAIALNKTDVVRALFKRQKDALAGEGRLPLIERGPGDGGSSPLVYAIVQNRPEVVRALLEEGADAGTLDKNGRAPLMYAVERNCVEVVREILKGGADIEQPNKDGYTPLMVAVSVGRPDMVKALLEAGANQNARSPSGERALDLAMRRNRRVVVGLLQEAGAS